ncbi:MAG: hypothetical protein LN573_03270 [Rickettsia endosymbiont of Oxypoda opaca]|nr:hypothetical protein [Rickettsia endosymbiont of Oxypoda opaca]
MQEAIDNNQGLQAFTRDFGKHINSTITRESEATPQNLQDRRLDSLSRLIACYSQCSAVCFDGEKILVAFNETHKGNQNTKNQAIQATLKHKDAVFSYLKDYAEYANLQPELAQENFLKDKDLKNRREKILIGSAQHYYSDQKNNGETLQHFLQELDKDEKNIINLGKTNELSGAAFKARQDLMKLEDALTLSTGKDKQFDSKIIEALKNEPKLVLDGPFDEKAHAEMRIVDYLKQRSRDSDNKLNRNIYIYI